VQLAEPEGGGPSSGLSLPSVQPFHALTYPLSLAELQRIAQVDIIISSIIISTIIIIIIFITA
jgi:hypothetical protein